MTRFMIIITLLCLGLASCSKNNETPTEVPASLQTLIDNNNNCICDPYIDLYTWRGQEVFLLAHKGPTCNWFPGYFDTNGDIIQMETNYTLDQFLGESTLVRKIWECSAN